MVNYSTHDETAQQLPYLFTNKIESKTPGPNRVKHRKMLKMVLNSTSSGKVNRYVGPVLTIGMGQVPTNLRKSESIFLSLPSENSVDRVLLHVA